MTSSVVCGADHSSDGRNAARLASALAERLRLRLVLGRDPACLSAVAEEESAEFVVVGMTGGGAAHVELMGTTSRTAPCPVVAVPPGVTYQPCATSAAESIVCGIAHPGDAAPVRVAARLAGELDLALLPAHVVSDGRDTLAATTAAGIRALLGSGDALEALVIREGEPARQLAQLADEARAALVVVGSRGRGDVRSGLLGSTSRDLARTSPAPVVICPARARAT